MANFPDIVTEYMENEDIDTGGKCVEFLYPFAMQVPGLQHIVYWVVLEGTSKLGFFAEWEHPPKSVLKFFHSGNHRGCIEDIVKANKSLTSTQAEDIVKSLARARGRFAEWRWKTLGTAVADLFHLETCMKLVMQAVVSGDASLGIRGSGETLSIKRCIGRRLLAAGPSNPCLCAAIAVVLELGSRLRLPQCRPNETWSTGTVSIERLPGTQHCQTSGCCSEAAE